MYRTPTKACCKYVHIYPHTVSMFVSLQYIYIWNLGDTILYIVRFNKVWWKSRSHIDNAVQPQRKDRQNRITLPWFILSQCSRGGPMCQPLTFLYSSLEAPHQTDDEICLYPANFIHNSAVHMSSSTKSSIICYISTFLTFFSFYTISLLFFTIYSIFCTLQYHLSSTCLLYTSRCV